MAERDVVLYPHSVLRKKCARIPAIDEELIRLARDMADTMYASAGIGLAAPQVGVPQQLIVLDIGDGLITLINPEIVIVEGTATMEEGCLCLPKLMVDVERYDAVQVKGTDLKGNPAAYDAEGLLARVFQHEIDHLSGTLIIDKLSKVKRDLLLKQLRKSRDKGQE